MSRTLRDHVRKIRDMAATEGRAAHEYGAMLSDIREQANIALIEHDGSEHTDDIYGQGDEPTRKGDLPAGIRQAGARMTAKRGGNQ